MSAELKTEAKEFISLVCIGAKPNHQELLGSHKEYKQQHWTVYSLEDM